MSIAQPRHELKKANQENVIPHLAAKGDGLKSSNVIRRDALGELGNQIHELQPARKDEKAVFAKPKEKAAIQLEGLKKHDKENVKTKKVVKIEPLKKIITREESILNAKKVAEAQKQVQSEKLKSIQEEPKEEVKAKNETKQAPDQDPSHSTDYTHDIMKYMQQLEVEFPIKKHFLTGTKVTASMRHKLVNWLVEVHQSFSMEQDTLFLAVSVADRFIEVNKSVDRTNYQLVGTAALMLAGKFVDVYPPSLDDYLYVCNDAFNRNQLMQMEVALIKSLDFRLGFSISIFFLRRFSKIAEVTVEEYQLSKYILELALLEYSVAHVRPSIQAAAAVCLAQGIFKESMTPGRTFWTPVFERITSYTYADFRHVLHEFACILNKAKSATNNTVKQKYASSKVLKVSTNLRLEGRLIKKYSVVPVKYEMI